MTYQFTGTFALPTDWRERAKRSVKQGIPVTMPDGTSRVVRNMLTEETQNLKLLKSGIAGVGFYSVGLSLAPFTQAGCGNVCPKATKGCMALCLSTAGKGGLPDVQKARVAKTRALANPETRPDAISLLVRQIEQAQQKSARKGLRLAVRLNVLSDIAWETLTPWLFTAFPTVRFYDYTKVIERLSNVPVNYDLTYSRHELSTSGELATALRLTRVAVVVNNLRDYPSALTLSGNAAPAIEGDSNDLRFREPKGVYVVLKAKGKARRSNNPFVVWNW